MTDKGNEVVIIDYKLGNLFSVQHACIRVGLDPVITSEKKKLLSARAIILPGVGAFSDAMSNLEKLDLVTPLKDQAQKGVPILGICLGLQLLFSESEEFGSSKGLDLVKGSVKRFRSNPENRKIRVPQIGWNTIYSRNELTWDTSPLRSIPQNEFMYFVHSYYAQPDNAEEIVSLTNYEEIEYCSSVIKNNIFATQFHPEKSANMGIRIYEDWATAITKNEN